MFELVSVRRVGAHPGEHQHGVSIQISKSSGKTFLRISRIRNNPLTWFLATVFVYILPFISRFWTLCINGFDFYFGLFWMAWHWKPAISCIWTVASITRTMYWTPKKVEKKKAVYWRPKHWISVTFPFHLTQCCRLILFVKKRETALLLKQ